MPIIFFLASCNVTNVDYLISDQQKILYSIKEIDDTFLKKDIIFIDITSQSLYFLKKGQVFKKYTISSSKYGTGSSEGSLKTPLGIHSIKQKIGKDLPLGAILKGRVWNGDIAQIISEPIDTNFDHVTSRVLWLEGLENGLNRGKGIDSYNRCIYIHGTAEEGLIGSPASDGCIRMYNDDVVDLYNLSEIDMPVLIF